MKKKKRKKENPFIGYAKEEKKTFLDSFKALNLNTIYIILLDILFIALIFFTAHSLKAIMYGSQASMGELSLLVQQNIAAMSKAGPLTQGTTIFNPEEVRDQIEKIKLKTKLKILLIYIIFLVGNALIKGSAWAMITKRKLSLKYYLKFLISTLIWVSLFIFIIISAYKIAVLKLYLPIPQIGMLLFAVIIILLYLTFILYSLIDEKKKLQRLFYQLFSVGILKIYRLIVPIIITAITFILLLIIFILLLIIPYIQLLIYILFLLSILLFAVWSRVYLAGIINKLGEK